MSDAYAPDEQPEFETAQLRRSKGGTGKVIAAIVLIAVMAAGGGFVWFAYPDLLSFPRAGATAPATASDDKMRLEELLTMHEQSVADIESVKQELANEQATLKTIADQLTALAGRIAAVENASHPQAPPEAARPPGPADPAAAAPKPRTAAKPKAAAPAHASGPVSVGGAPLTTPHPQ